MFLFFFISLDGTVCVPVGGMNRKADISVVWDIILCMGIWTWGKIKINFATLKRHCFQIHIKIGHSFLKIM